MTWGQGHGPRLGKIGWQRQRDNQRILDRDGHRCSCGRPARRVDHVRNLAAGGNDDDINKAAICDVCHDEKTKREQAAGRSQRSRRRPPEPHPGLKE